MNIIERTLGEFMVLLCKLFNVTPAQLERVRRSHPSPLEAFVELRRAQREADEQRAAIYRLRYGCPAG